MITLKVAGRPAPQGSKRHVGRGRLIEASKYHGPWREAVTLAAYQKASYIDQLEGPLHLHAIFHITPPKILRRLHPTVAPDLDKLIRTICDALQLGGLIINDAQIVSITAKKIYDPEWSGVVLKLSEVNE